MTNTVNRTRVLKRVVVTGLGLVTPLGVGVKHSWENLKLGLSGISNKLDDRFDKCACRLAGLVPVGSEGLHQFDIDRFTRFERRSMPLASLYGLVAAAEALKDAKWKPQNEHESSRSGVAVGMAMVDLDYIAQCHQLVQDGNNNKIGPYFIPRILPNLAAGHISIRHNLQGPLHSASTACATGCHSIGDAFHLIQNDTADVMLAGAVDACVTPLALTGFSRARALTSRIDDGASCPFDRERDGFVLGEGAGIIVLEELGHALARKANIYCEVLGYGLAGDASHITTCRSDGLGACLSMKAAFRDAGLDHSRSSIWYVNAHATSTPKGDIAEAKAIGNLFSEAVNVTSNKGHIGHLMGAAGSVETIFSVLSISEGYIPATLNVLEVDEDVRQFVNVVTKNIPQSSSQTINLTSNNVVYDRLVLKNSFGFGGINASLLLARLKFLEA